MNRDKRNLPHNFIDNSVYKGLFMVLLLSAPIMTWSQTSDAPLFGQGIRYTNVDTTLHVKFNFRLQNLFEANYNQETDEWNTQFLVRRARIKLAGFALSPKLSYKAELGLSGLDVTPRSEAGNGAGSPRIILDAVLKWQLHSNWSLWIGQTKLPGNRERVISSANLQFVNRSLVNSQFNIDRDVGLQLRGKFHIGKTQLNPSVAFSQGEGRNITSDNFGGFNYTAHLDFLPLGGFESNGDYVSADLVRESTPKLALGVTYDYNDRSVRQGGQLGLFVTDIDGQLVENSLTTFMADMMFKYNGFSMLSEYARKTGAEEIEGISAGFRTGTGFTVQAGYLLSNNIEFAARYTTIRRDVQVSGISDQNEVTMALSKYIVGHSLKVQADLSRTAAPGSSDGVIRFRTQIEMQF